MTLTERVHLTLDKWPDTRNEEALLLCNIWRDEMDLQRISLKDQTTFRFMELLIEGKISSPSEITETAIKVQIDHPELRGDHFNFA